MNKRNGHILTDNQIPQFMKDKLFWIDDDKKFMHRKLVETNYRPSSLSRKLEWMEKCNIDHGVMFVSQIYCNGWHGDAKDA